MKLQLAALLLCGLSLSLALKPSKHGHQQQLFRQASRTEPPVDKFNFIDIELLQLAAESAEGNIVLSPASVKTTLSMLWEGADGRSAKEIGLALRLSGQREHQEEQLHQYQHHLATRSNGAVPSSLLKVASRLFASERVSISPKYSDSLANYNAQVQTVNMSDALGAANSVNSWVEKATGGLVPALIQPDSLSDSTVMVLANAIYFSGTWQTAFDPALTQEACFKGGPEPARKCPKVMMMETMGSFRSKLIPELDATLLELPYDDGRFAMLILLPERDDGMPQLVRDLAHANLLHVLNSDLEDAEYSVSIPKFTIEFNTDLVPILNKLKVVDIFTPTANLTRMVNQDETKVDAAVNNVFHKAKVLVDERGAIAAGATGALVVPLMGGPQPRFRADHPFLFFIRDMRTGGFLFAGRVSDP